MASQLHHAASQLRVGQHALNHHQSFLALQPSPTNLKAVSYYIDHFDFTDTTYLSSWWVLLVAPAYFTLLYVLRRYVHEVRRKPFDLHYVVVVHNAMLSLASAVLWISIVAELYQLFSRFGFWAVYCDPNHQVNEGRIIYIYYLNYVFKYVELFDTVLLALRGKPMPFLHTYHHAATLILCWSQLRARSCVQWIPIAINLWIHIIMYCYYTLHQLKIDVWWKRYLTMLQILQFIVALVGCTGGLVFRWLSSIGWLGPQYNCRGEFSAAYFGLGVLATYLILFVQLYNNNYHKKRRAGKKSTEAVAPAVVDAAVSLQNHVNGHTIGSPAGDTKKEL